MKKNVFFQKKNIKLTQLFPNLKFKKKIKVIDIKPLYSASENDITFFDSINYMTLASKTKSKICITNKKLEKFLPKYTERVIVDNVLFELARVLKQIYPQSDIDQNDKSLKNPSKKHFKSVDFGNNVLIGKKVKIGNNSQIGANTIIEKNVVIGKNCFIGYGSIIRNTIIDTR